MGSLHHVASCEPMIKRALFVSHDLCRDQRDHELNRYANYLTANVNLLEKAAMQLCCVSAMKIECAVFFSLVQWKINRLVEHTLLAAKGGCICTSLTPLNPPLLH